jgi:predicted DNA-binding transcriptional regulator AlpA
MPYLETFGVKDLMRIFNLSRESIYRRLREARDGRGGLPLPIPTGTKRSLRWDAATIRRFVQNADSTPQTPLTLPFESAKSRQKRHAKAMKQLERFGIQATNQEQE